MRLGHSGLNKTLFLIKKHPSRMCNCEREEETVENVNVIVPESQRQILKEEINKYGVKVLNLKKNIVYRDNNKQDMI